MAMERPKVGQQITINSGGTHEPVTVTAVWDYTDNNMSGYCVEYRTKEGLDYHKFVVEQESYAADIMAASGMPYSDRAKRFDWNYYGANMELVKRIVNSYVDSWKQWRESGRGLYIYSGVNGSGKTYLACCVGNEIIYRYNSQVEFVSTTDYIGLLTENKQRASELRDSVLLILDDIGAQSEKQDWISEALFRLVDHRYREKLPTIYTSNKPLNLASKNDRVTSRMFERSQEVKLPEVSVREILAKRAKDEFLRDLKVPV